MSYTPGYPEDRRTEAQRLRAFAGPLGDEEAMAARVVSRYTGAHVLLLDDNSEARLPDLRINYSDGRVGMGEVTTDLPPGWAAASSLTRNSGGTIEASTLRYRWWLYLRHARGISELRRVAPEILHDAEASDDLQGPVPASVIGSAESWKQRLERLGVADVIWATPTSGAHVIELLPAGNGGSVVIDEAAFIEWVDNFTSGELVKRKTDKLQQFPEAHEHHLFVVLSLQTDWNVLQALSRDTRWVPSINPRLTETLSHLWLMEAPFVQRCLLYKAEGGWIDVDRHWRTE
ncbi:MAG: hypothetical protein H0X39_13515 [Actinobacteria bacterium]|nr:hypothetical protein [Actinomycetota bacterium]